MHTTVELLMKVAFVRALPNAQLKVDELMKFSPCT
jgi:hypothetical protein